MVPGDPPTDALALKNVLLLLGIGLDPWSSVAGPVELPPVEGTKGLRLVGGAVGCFRAYRMAFLLSRLSRRAAFLASLASLRSGRFSRFLPDAVTGSTTRRKSRAMTRSMFMTHARRLQPGRAMLREGTT